MTESELVRSWKRTEAFLRDARAHLSQIAEAEFVDMTCPEYPRH